jgi:hypothetical protein
MRDDACDGNSCTHEIANLDLPPHSSVQFLVINSARFQLDLSTLATSWTTLNER